MDGEVEGCEAEGEAGVEDSVRGEAEATWVQCEVCDKWRRLPADAAALDEELPWYCSMNEDKCRNTCEAEEDPMEEDLVEEEDALELASVVARRMTEAGAEQFRIRWAPRSDPSLSCKTLPHLSVVDGPLFEGPPQICPNLPILCPNLPDPLPNLPDPPVSHHFHAAGKAFPGRRTRGSCVLISLIKGHSPSLRRARSSAS